MKRSILLLTLLVHACEEGPTNPLAASRDAGGEPDAGAGTLDAGQTLTSDAGGTGAWRWTPTPVSGAGLGFGTARLEGDLIEAPLLGQALESVNGLAVYLRFDPEVLELVGIAPRPGWIHDDGLWEWAEAFPGEVSFAASAIGQGPPLDLDGVAFAEVRFRRRVDRPSRVDLARGRLVHRDLRSLTVATGSATLEMD